MDPARHSAQAHAQSSTSASTSTRFTNDVKSFNTTGHSDGHPSESDSGGEEDDNQDNQDNPDNPDRQSDGAKRPRLRLAHACDRCRKRKIRCDTQQPCGPCQATKNECTFHTPSRRVVTSSSKPKDATFRTNSTLGVKRPYSPPRAGLLAGVGHGQANLEARLAALEAMLGDVPPKVHNAFLSSLDARLGSGTGVGIKEGKGEGVGVALEALSGSNAFNPSSSVGLDEFGLGNSNRTWSNQGTMGASTTLAPDWNDWNSLASGSGWQDGRGLGRKEDEGVNEMAKRMEGMSFFYEDEIGQAKWQGGYHSQKQTVQCGS